MLKVICNIEYKPNFSQKGIPNRHNAAIMYRNCQSCALPNIQVGGGSLPASGYSEGFVNFLASFQSRSLLNPGNAAYDKAYQMIANLSTKTIKDLKFVLISDLNWALSTKGVNMTVDGLYKLSGLDKPTDINGNLNYVQLFEAIIDPSQKALSSTGYKQYHVKFSFLDGYNAGLEKGVLNMDEHIAIHKNFVRYLFNYKNVEECINPVSDFCTTNEYNKYFEFLEQEVVKNLKKSIETYNLCNINGFKVLIIADDAKKECANQGGEMFSDKQFLEDACAVSPETVFATNDGITPDITCSNYMKEIAFDSDGGIIGIVYGTRSLEHLSWTSSI